MSNNTRITVKSLHAAQVATDARLGNIETLLTALLDAQAPAKVTRPKAAKPAAKKPVTRKAAEPKAPVKVKALCKATRVAFIAAAAKNGVDLAGCSTKAIALMCLEDEALIPAGFAIGEGYRALFSA